MSKKGNSGPIPFRKPETRTLTEKHKEQLRAANNEVNQGLIVLGQLELKRAEIEAEAVRVRNAVAQATVARSSKLTAAAMALDIDIEKEDWSIDWDKGVFTKGRAPGAMQILATPQQVQAAQAEAQTAMQAPPVVSDGAPAQ